MIKYLASITFLSALVSGAALVNGGCTRGTSVNEFECAPDADIYFCKPDGGSGIEPLACESAGGQCIAMGGADFRREAVLVWLGAEEEAPQCPERADNLFYEGYSELEAFPNCAKCSCEPATCALPNVIGAHSSGACLPGNVIDYAAPNDWNGGCASPSVLPAGSFASIALHSPTVTACKPVGDIPPAPPGVRKGPAGFSEGVYWGQFARACQGSAKGECASTGDLCLPTAEPPPPGFRQCVQYTLPVDEAHLPSCPEAFPEQHVFYAGYEGKVECSPCECGEPVGGSCTATISAYQDPNCGGVPLPLFENIPAGAICIDISASPMALGAMSAQWVKNNPGTCAPSGGEPVGAVKGIDPRLFCCMAPPTPTDK